MNFVELGNALVYSASAMGKHVEHIIPTFHFHCLSAQGWGERWCVKQMKYLYFILLCSYIFKPTFVIGCYCICFFFLIVFLLGRCHHAGGACLQRGCWPSDRLTDVGKKWQDNPHSPHSYTRTSASSQYPIFPVFVICWFSLAFSLYMGFKKTPLPSSHLDLTI